MKKKVTVIDGERLIWFPELAAPDVYAGGKCPRSPLSDWWKFLVQPSGGSETGA